MKPAFEFNGGTTSRSSAYAHFPQTSFAPKQGFADKCVPQCNLGTRNKKISLLAVAILGCFLSTGVRADIKLPSIFGDHMVLQQDAKLPVWGTADAGEKITVTIGADTATTTAGADGKWRVDLAPLPGSVTATTMTIAGKTTLTINDVLVGEVWFASGQSNMAFNLARTLDAATDVPAANDPQLRFFHVNNLPGLEPSHNLSLGGWALTTPKSAPGFSGVAYYFAKALRAKLNRPVGIVQSAVGGTLAQAWTPLEYLKKDPSLQPYVDGYDKANAAFPQLNSDYQARFDAWHKDALKWQAEVGATYTPLLTSWQAEVEKDKLAGVTPPPKPEPSRPSPIAPIQPWGGQNTPTVLFNGEVAPVIPYAIKGAIWYQGESNAGDWAKYRAVLTQMITGWRDHWGQGDFPFLIVQLPRLLGGGGWPQIREAQAQVAATLPNTALATVFDVGDPHNLHPINKKPVGERLALVARHAVYGEKDLVWTGPIYDAMKVEGNAIRVSFTQTGSGLVIGSSPWVPPYSEPIPTTSLIGFYVAGADKKWFEATAKIDGTTVVVSSDKVATPTAVRYGWQNSPVCNLYNKEGLPASPFRTDDWANVDQVPAPGAAPAAAPAPTAPPPTK